MQEEIKEILNQLEYFNEEDYKYYSDFKLNRNQIKQLLDCITNLQEENEYSNRCNEELRKKITNLEYKIERQKEELNEQYKQRDKFKKKYSYLKVAKEDYKSRNEKAIEYINNNSLYEEIYDYNTDDEQELQYVSDETTTNDLLNILQGVDKE